MKIFLQCPSGFFHFFSHGDLGVLVGSFPAETISLQKVKSSRTRQGKTSLSACHSRPDQGNNVSCLYAVGGAERAVAVFSEAHLQGHVEGHSVFVFCELLDDRDRRVDRLVGAAGQQRST